MRIKINDESREVDAKATLSEVVEQELPGADARRGVAVAVDHQVVRRSQWPTTILTEDAQIEIVTAVQGG